MAYTSVEEESLEGLLPFAGADFNWVSAIKDLERTEILNLKLRLRAAQSRYNGRTNTIY
jgi:hypothetical protein